MIGKKSKFEEHERKSNLQVQEDENRERRADLVSKPGILEEGSNKKRRSSTQSETFVETSGDTYDEIEQSNSFIAETIFTTGGGSEEEIQEIPEEIQNLEPELVPLRPSRENKSNSSSEKSDSGLSQKASLDKNATHSNSITILSPLNIKTDTDLLWDEICNGVKGKNSGIPMGFNRLNKYL